MFSPSITSGQCISSLVLPHTHPTRQFWALMRRQRWELQSNLPPMLVLPFLCPQMSTHWICPAGSSRYHGPDDKSKSNFKVCCGCFFSVWMWVFSCKHGAFLSQAWRRCGYKVLQPFFEKENLPCFCPVLASNSFQSKDIFKSQLLQTGWNRSL